ncbi:ciliogenesis-associated TTC17-interacting protein isoform X1 [Gallus gallus]|uniref:ciliogenesis-associated TTC17-interacting protein isoform X1 n=1 Tax=Gallus gallus TaxID=9031 RepID=UPI001AE201A9|nr:ciliogenesis-associated TTC17-interacting protein isoform X1 [Gallus gallus]XP_046778094.1 ciliogenesis-associated TTC17-interacting protein isoform X1 [Gallus gallus]XP_046778095.1 ciliogenesis-associated TTC17-interacting protein isoform X1 [Gallus gallus]XP_046778096.1 ciliogenesis-associated TTC17-interacting protein isoform X1 [Gallus gallus]XP_046778097.1 ciliogenesis-associated TTC17-interacting protein isoform X1 [Gallus gallus]
MEAAAKFLNHIGPEELESCLFEETLALVAAGGRPQGHLWVTARHAPYEQEGQQVRSCLLLQAGSKGLLDGVPYSCRLTGYVSMQLETLEQEQHERLEFGAHPTERKIHMVQHPHGMTVTVTTREGEAEPQHQVFSYGWASLEGLLGEAASLLLLRVLACRRAVPPSITFPAIDKEGHLCTTTYRSLGVQQQPVGSTQVEVLVVERALHAAQGIPMVWYHSLLPSGHLARRVQVGCPVVAVLQDALALSSTGAEPQPLFPKQLLDWEEDAQLCSWFLDRKEELRASHSTYVQQHPELFALLADFLQALLLRQPQNPILFAAEFFAPFARRQPPGPSFASSVSLSPFCSTSCPNPPPQGD